MGEKFKFLDWPVYKDSRNLFSFVISLIKKLPQQYRFELGNQILRSSFSVSLNIAEGSGKSTKKDFSHFLDISLGSLYETIVAADMLRDNKLITETEFQTVLEKADKISRQLGGFKKSLKKT